MVLNMIRKKFRYHFYFYLVVTIILVILIFVGYENKWAPLIAFCVGVIPLCFTRFIQFTDEQDAIKEYEPVITRSLKARYYRDGDQINGRWFIQLDISLRKSYAIIPKSMALLDKDSKELKWLLEPYKVKRRGADDSKIFWNKEVEGGSFKLDLQCPEFKVKPDIHGEFSIKFVYDIARREDMERYYPIHLLE